MKGEVPKQFLAITNTPSLHSLSSSPPHLGNCDPISLGIHTLLTMGTPHWFILYGKLISHEQPGSWVVGRYLYCDFMTSNCRKLYPLETSLWKQHHNLSIARTYAIIRDWFSPLDTDTNIINSSRAEEGCHVVIQTTWPHGDHNCSIGSVTIVSISQYWSMCHPVLGWGHSQCTMG